MDNGDGTIIIIVFIIISTIITVFIIMIAITIEYYRCYLYHSYYRLYEVKPSEVQVGYFFPSFQQNKILRAVSQHLRLYPPVDPTPARRIKIIPNYCVFLGAHARAVRGRFVILS